MKCFPRLLLGIKEIAHPCEVTGNLVSRVYRFHLKEGGNEILTCHTSY